MTTPAPDRTALLAELEAVPREQRLAYLAGLPEERLVAFKRILPRDDIGKLNAEVARRLRERRTPTLATWRTQARADARAGRATTPEAMIDVLREDLERLRPEDATWVRRIEETAAAGSFSKRQSAVIAAIYERYFVSRGAD